MVGMHTYCFFGRCTPQSLRHFRWLDTYIYLGRSNDRGVAGQIVAMSHSFFVTTPTFAYHFLHYTKFQSIQFHMVCSSVFSPIRARSRVLISFMLLKICSIVVVVLVTYLSSLDNVMQPEQYYAAGKYLWFLGT